MNYRGCMDARRSSTRFLQERYESLSISFCCGWPQSYALVVRLAIRRMESIGSLSAFGTAKHMQHFNEGMANDHSVASSIVSVTTTDFETKTYLDFFPSSMNLTPKVLRNHLQRTWHT